MKKLTYFTYLLLFCFILSPYKLFCNPFTDAWQWAGKWWRHQCALKVKEMERRRHEALMSAQAEEIQKIAQELEGLETEEQIAKKLASMPPQKAQKFLAVLDPEDQQAVAKHMNKLHQQAFAQLPHEQKKEPLMNSLVGSHQARQQFIWCTALLNLSQKSCASALKNAQSEAQFMLDANTELQIIDGNELKIAIESENQERFTQCLRNVEEIEKQKVHQKK